MASLRIRDATILTQDDHRRVVQGDVLVEDGRVTHVGAIPGSREADRTIDGRGQVLLPGLINLHTHLAMTLLRGYADDMHLEAWLRDRIWPAEDRIQERHMRAGVELALLELIASGTTSFLDMYWMEQEVVAPCASKAGVRAWAGEGMVDVGQTAAGEPNRKVAVVERSLKANRDPLVTFCPSPHGTYTCHAETYAESARLAHEHGVPLHTHCGETRTEVYDVQARTGLRPVGRLAAAGALMDRTVLAHCGWTTKEEVRQVAAAGAAVAHCPVSNLKLATGSFAPVPEFHAAGVKVGLGTDGAASNNTLDLFETMKFAALLQKTHRWDATVLPAQRVLDMATRDAADALRRPDLGRIVPGATADLVMVDFRRPHLVPRHDAVSHLVYAASGRDVSTTIVAGRVLKADHRVESMDAQAVMDAAENAARDLVQASA
ncbi:MAG: 5-methylthioadenosine/S-adenosylhomocysteine deaminase [Thermoplasmata archaeon]|nr:5-methylthioadenosine/S-adenosylhomocysteine deaminase [Thermoplasmata archaeon]